MLVGFFITAGHEARAPERAFFTAADAHAEELDSGGGQFLEPAFGVGEQGVAAVDDDVAGFESRGFSPSSITCIDRACRP
jgi:hypothetical protein